MTSNDEWRALWRESESSRPDAARAAVSAAADEAQRLFNVSTLMRAAYGWSGGKDSLALQVVVEELRRRRAGAVPTGVLGILRHVEFPAYLSWCDEHLPGGVVVRSNDAVDLQWLARNDRYLFPATGKLGYRWTMLGTRWAQTWHQRAVGATVMLYGRRTADGNVCGDRDGLMRGAAGPCYNPLRRWSHRLTLEVVRHLWLPGESRRLPPIYDAADGWVSGTGSWPGRHMPWWRGKADGWASTYAIDADVVRAAARVLPSARAFLDGVE